MALIEVNLVPPPAATSAGDVPVFQVLMGTSSGGPGRGRLQSQSPPIVSSSWLWRVREGFAYVRNESASSGLPDVGGGYGAGGTDGHILAKVVNADTDWIFFVNETVEVAAIAGGSVTLDSSNTDQFAEVTAAGVVLKPKTATQTAMIAQVNAQLPGGWTQVPA